MADDSSYFERELTQGGGREVGREERRARVSTLRFTGSVADKWKPLSAGATKLLCDTMEAAVV